MLSDASLRVLPLVALASLAACNDAPGLPDIAYTVFQADGTNPLTGRSLTVARAYFASDVPGAVEDSTESPIANGTFDLVVPVDDFAVPMMVRLELASASGVELVGGTPSYYPAESQSIAVLVGEPGSCDPVAGLTIGAARHSIGAALAGRYVLLSGGVGANADSAEVDVLDTLAFGQYDLTAATAALGATRSAAIDRSDVLVVPASGSPYAHHLFETGTDPGRPEVAVHPGANTADAIVEAGRYGAAIVGGGSEASPSNQLSWVAPRTGSANLNAVTIQSLNAAEPDRAAAFAPNGLWIVSGGVGPTTLEQVVGPGVATSVHLADLAGDGIRRGAMLFANATGTSFLLLGGVDGSDQPRTDTVAITGCPEACVYAAGPTWTNARTAVASDPSGFLVGGLVAGTPSALVERVTFASGAWSIVAFATLAAARADARIVRFPTGSTLVLGGRDTAPRSDVEICFGAP